jgi:hypothetical protein
MRILVNSAATLQWQSFDFVDTRVRKQFFPARFETFENIFFVAPSAATSTQAGGSRESIRSYRQPFKTTGPDPFDTSASRRKIGDSLEVATLLRV